MSCLSEPCSQTAAAATLSEDNSIVVRNLSTTTSAVDHLKTRSAPSNYPLTRTIECSPNKNYCIPF
eukprot:4978633-Amphidinium_carterae.1